MLPTWHILVLFSHYCRNFKLFPRQCLIPRFAWFQIIHLVYITGGGIFLTSHSSATYVAMSAFPKSSQLSFPPPQQLYPGTASSPTE
jgi:hypothetical protein